VEDDFRIVSNVAQATVTSDSLDRTTVMVVESRRDFDVEVDVVRIFESEDIPRFEIPELDRLHILTSGFYYKHDQSPSQMDESSSPDTRP
jgi:hypothetical protein